MGGRTRHLKPESLCRTRRHHRRHRRHRRHRLHRLHRHRRRRHRRPRCRRHHLRLHRHRHHKRRRRPNQLWVVECMRTMTAHRTPARMLLYSHRWCLLVLSWCYK